MGISVFQKTRRSFCLVFFFFFASAASLDPHHRNFRLSLSSQPPPNPNQKNKKQSEVAEELANDKVFIQPGADASGRPVVIITVRKHHKNHNAAALARLKRFICWVFDVCVAKATGMSVTEDGSGGEAAGEVEVGGAVGEEEEAEEAGAPSSPPRPRRPAAPLGDGKLTAIFDLRGASMENMDVAGLKQIFGLLQSHFPERLGRMVFLDPPVIFWGVWRVVSPFVDPVTRAKVVMASLRDLSEGDIVPLRILPEDMGGEAQARSVVEAASELGLLPRGVDVAALAAEAGERRARSASGSPEKASSSAGAAAGEGRAAAVAGASAASAAASADDDEEDEEGFEDAVDDDEDQPDDEEVAALEEAMQRELRMGSANGDENALPGVGGAGAAAAPKVGAVFVAAAAAVVRE